MKLFGRGKGDDDERYAALERRVHALESAHRTLENEQLKMHDQVHKWMRRAVAAERNQERRAEPAQSMPAATPANPPRRPATLHGASMRSYMRRLEEYAASLRGTEGNVRRVDMHDGEEPVANGSAEGE